MSTTRQMKCLFEKLVVIVAFIVASSSCERRAKTLFAIREGGDIGIDFENTITTTDSLNALSFEYIYNGSGVGVGDFNDDGLPDLFFGGNQVSSKLYLNRSAMKFEDITEKAGVTTTRWITGVSVIDINQDGRQDIYLSVAGKTSEDNRKNLLFINQGLKDGIPSFKESASAYGLDDNSYSTMAAFFDYDKDGDPDLYLVNNWLETFNRNNLRAKRVNGEAPSTDKLYRNNGDNTFTDVSREAGILIEGYGLGINIADLNNDSWPDVYVSNDFMSNDLIWINQQNGTFKNMAGEYLKHQTHNGMGIDIADFNNDELADVIVVDMLPPGHVRQKMMTPGQNYDHFYMSMQMGYEPQYMRNTLQLNRGLIDGVPAFSEIAFLAGVAKTDWSWAPLFVDLDNDGWKDLFIANGYRKDVTDLDFIFFGMERDNPFGTPEARKRKINSEFEKIADVKLSNYVFRNTGSLRFEDKSVDWGFDFTTFTNGAAYADLDNDGDQDVITNNIDQAVIIYENHTSNERSAAHFIKLQSTEPGVFNQKIFIYTDGNSQYCEYTPYHGFQSTVSQEMHFGLGKSSVVDSIVIEYPDHSVLRYTNVPADTLIRFHSKNSMRSHSTRRNGAAPETFRFEKKEAVMYDHHETSPSDIKNTRTLLHELSRFGPCIAVGDINHDNREDLFIGGERGHSAQLKIQLTDGTFKRIQFATDSAHEDGAAHFFDADKDGDLDLYVGSCSPSSIEDAGEHRMYLNDSNGNFTLSTDLIPNITTSASCVVSSDYDNDGDIDLFVGGRIKPNEYPLSPRSYILRNDNGKFVDATRILNDDLEFPGMVSSAAWLDIDNDNRKDLLIAGEWMPLRLFRNNGDRLQEVSSSAGLLNTEGWWNCVRAADVNKDGYIDIVAGNVGKNSYFEPIEKEPVQIVAKDFDKNGSIDPIITYYNSIEKERFVVHNRMVLLDQVPMLKKRFETFRQYATTPFKKIFSDDQLADATVMEAKVLASCIFINEKGTFRLVELPEVAQFSPTNDLVIDDVNADGHSDLILVGNNYAQETLFGRYDASFGTILLGDGKLNWRESPVHSNGFDASGDVRFIKKLNSVSEPTFILIRNNGPLTSFRLRR
jgi:enediyne biosynthesis protein E4